MKPIHAVRGRTLVPGCGHGHEVALAVEHGLDATGLDIAPTAVAEARALYPQLAERLVIGDLFNPPVEMRGAFVGLSRTRGPRAGARAAAHSEFSCRLDIRLRRTRAENFVNFRP